MFQFNAHVHSQADDGLFTCDFSRQISTSFISITVAKFANSTEKMGIYRASAVYSGSGECLMALTM
jgi:hypothetical protein